MQKDKKIINNKFIKTSFLSIGSFVLFLLVGNYFLHIGSLVNIFYSCDDTISSSMFLHCYDIYDVYLSVALLVISIISFLATISGIISNYIKKKKTTN